MAENQHTNKVVLGSGEVLIDLSGDTVDKARVLKGDTFHDKTGAPVTGACTYDSDTQDATVAAGEILAGKSGYARGAKVVGTMPNNGAVAGDISKKEDSYIVPQGFHDGSGKVRISAAERAKLIAGNIKAGITILGVDGAYSGESVKAESKNITPSFEAQTVQPSAGYDYLASVVVAAIPVAYTDNSAGGKTATIG